MNRKIEYFSKLSPLSLLMENFQEAYICAAFACSPEDVKEPLVALFQPLIEYRKGVR